MSRNRKNEFGLFSKALKAIGYDVELVINIPEKAIEKAVSLLEPIAEDPKNRKM